MNLRSARSLAAPFAAALLLLAGTLPAFAEGDLIEKPDGSFLPAIDGEAPTAADFAASNYEIIDANNRSISYNLVVNDRKLKQNYPAEKAREIWLAPANRPQEYNDALRDLSGGAFEDASAKFLGVAANKNFSDLIRQKAMLRASRARRGAGDANGAARILQDLLSSFGDTFYQVQIWKDLTAVHMDRGDMAAARKAAQTLLGLKGVTEGDKMEAEILLLQINYSEAVAKKDKAAIGKVRDEAGRIAGRLRGDAEKKGALSKALVLQANATLELGDVSKAKGLFEQIVGIANENWVLASAHNGLGECWFRQGDREGWLEARRHFLRTTVLYSDGAAGNDIARALLRTGECFGNLRDSDDWQDRARRELGEVIRRFGSTDWAQRARNVMTTLK